MYAGMLLARQRLSDEARLPAALADLTAARVYFESRLEGGGLFAGSAPLVTGPASMRISARLLDLNSSPSRRVSEQQNALDRRGSFSPASAITTTPGRKATMSFDLRRGRPPRTDDTMVVHPPFRAGSQILRAVPQINNFSAQARFARDNLNIIKYLEILHSKVGKSHASHFRGAEQL